MLAILQQNCPTEKSYYFKAPPVFHMSCRLQEKRSCEVRRNDRDDALDLGIAAGNVPPGLGTSE
jgi:hypothetical protein